MSENWRQRDTKNNVNIRGRGGRGESQKAGLGNAHDDRGHSHSDGT